MGLQNYRPGGWSAALQAGQLRAHLEPGALDGGAGEGVRGPLHHVLGAQQPVLHPEHAPKAAAAHHRDLLELRPAGVGRERELPQRSGAPAVAVSEAQGKLLLAGLGRGV